MNYTQDKSLFIDEEALITLAMARDGLLKPVEFLMDKRTAKKVDKEGMYNNCIFPFSFILAPTGKRNKEVLNSSKKGDKLNLICNDKKYGTITVDEIFKIDKDQRVKKIYGTNNPEHLGVKDTYKRLGSLAISGEYEIDFDHTRKNIKKINQAKKELNAKDISSIILSGKPFHRVHERLIRTALVKCDLLIIFLQKPYHDNDELNYETRYKTLKYFIDNFLPKDRILLLPLENTYIFGGVNELTLNTIVSKNYGATKLVIGQNHGGLGVFWDDKKLVSIVDTLEKLKINIEVMSEFVYCDKCTTLVSTNTCPHGSHHHVKYHNGSIMELFRLGIIPPTILMRKEISAIILSAMYPNRLNRLRKIYENLSTSSGVIDDFDSNDFYNGLMNLYQTSSLT